MLVQDVIMIWYSPSLLNVKEKISFDHRNTVNSNILSLIR